MIQSTSNRIWKKIDSDTESMTRGGKTVPDHRASRKANFKEAGSTIRSIGYGWAAVATGQAIMGGGNPADRVARAEGTWNKTKTAVLEHGGNAIMALTLTGMGLIGAATDTIHGVAHGVLGLFQRGDGDASAAASATGVNNLRD